MTVVDIPALPPSRSSSICRIGTLVGSPVGGKEPRCVGFWFCCPRRWRDNFQRVDLMNNLLHILPVYLLIARKSIVEQIEAITLHQ